MNSPTRAWRLALVTSGVLMAAGGAQHPDVDPSGTFREELAAMTADDRWVTGHALTLAGTVLLAAGLWLAVRSRSWPVAVRRPLRVAAVAVSVYVVEVAVHLAAAVDADALAAGDAAPVAFGHLALAAVLYPLSGAALVVLGVSLVASGRGVRRAVAALVVVAGVLHAAALPFTFLLPDAERTPLFAGSGVLLSLWALATGALGTPRRTPGGAATEDVREPLLVG